MLFRNYKKMYFYNNLQEINFPKSNSSNKAGKGVMVYTLSPNKERTTDTLSLIKNGLKDSSIRRFIIENLYRYKIGNKKIMLNDKASNEEYYLSMKDFPLQYIKHSMVESVTGKAQYSVVVELSRWMDLFFKHSTKLSAEKKCGEFINLLNSITSKYPKSYLSLILINIDEWISKNGSIIIGNKNLLNNPISILTYAATFYPEVYKELNEFTLMIINNKHNLFMVDTNSISKGTISKVRTNIKKFGNVGIAGEDDPIETKSEDREKIKEEVRANLTKGLTGDDENASFSTISDNDDDEDIESGRDEDTELTEIEQEADEISDLDNESNMTLSERTTVKIISSFTPERTDAQMKKNEELKTAQDALLMSKGNYKPLEERMRVDTSITGGYLKNIINQNIQDSKFVNFDKNYVEKCMVKNIDDSIAALSNASEKIFITDKIVEDSSTPMDIKETYTYSLVDEKGHKMNIKFDIPKIIDGNKMWINGSMKYIKHQLILKPIVKTGPSTVQLVTAYAKIFIDREGAGTVDTMKFINYINKSKNIVHTVGNCNSKNAGYLLPLDFSTFSKYFTSMTIGDVTFTFAIPLLLDKYKRMHKKDMVYDQSKECPIGFNNKTKEFILLNHSDSITNHMINLLSPDIKSNVIDTTARKSSLMNLKATLMNKQIPIIAFMLYCDGFTEVMKKANIDYVVVSKRSDMKSYDMTQYGSIKIADGFILWKKSPLRNELLMNGFSSIDLSQYTLEELDSKYTYISMMADFYPDRKNIYNALDNFRDFMINEKDKEILAHFNYPTDLVELMIVAAEMLCDNTFKRENDMHNLRIRNVEVISDLVYLATTSSYTKYRETAYKKRPSKISIKQSAIIDKLLASDTNMVEEVSDKNPMLEVEKQRSVSYKGLRGIQKDRAMTLARRAYDKSMLGVLGITTPADGNVGIVRFMTVEPKVTSTYGYTEAAEDDTIESLNSTNLFTTAELSQPFGILHNDPDRSAMSAKQTRFMMPTKRSSPVIVGNKIESVIPYMLSDAFINVAKDSGKVIDISNDFLIIEYKDGIKQAIDIGPRITRDTAEGMWMDNSFICNLKVGDKFNKGDVLAYANRQFTKHEDDGGASLNNGAIAKVAIYTSWDIYEDSMPVDSKLSDDLTTSMVEEKAVNLSKYSRVDKIKKVGDTVTTGEPLIVFSDAMTSEMQNLFDSMREDVAESIVENSKTTISSKFTGTIVDMRIYTTVESDELDPTLKKIVDGYHSRIKKRNAVLDKYANKGDLNNYKAGQVISETTDIINISKSGKVAGHFMKEGEVLIIFFIEFEMNISKGDKMVGSVCKGTASHVIEKGQEAFTMYRPEESINAIFSPLAIAARKVPEMLMTLFSYKVVIETERQMCDIYFNRKK